MRKTVENAWGRGEKLSPTESRKDAQTVLRPKGPVLRRSVRSAHTASNMQLRYVAASWAKQRVRGAIERKKGRRMSQISLSFRRVFLLIHQLVYLPG